MLLFLFMFYSYFTQEPVVNKKPPGGEKGADNKSPDQSSAGQNQTEGKQQGVNKSKVRRRRETDKVSEDDPKKQKKTEVVHEETDQV